MSTSGPVGSITLTSKEINEFKLIITNIVKKEITFHGLSSLFKKGGVVDEERFEKFFAFYDNVFYLLRQRQIELKLQHVQLEKKRSFRSKIVDELIGYMNILEINGVIIFEGISREKQRQFIEDRIFNESPVYDNQAPATATASSATTSSAAASFAQQAPKLLPPACGNNLIFSKPSAKALAQEAMKHHVAKPAPGPVPAPKGGKLPKKAT